MLREVVQELRDVLLLLLGGLCPLLLSSVPSFFFYKEGSENWFTHIA